jgi:hypothetical protein
LCDELATCGTAEALQPVLLTITTYVANGALYGRSSSADVVVKSGMLPAGIIIDHSVVVWVGPGIDVSLYVLAARHADIA